MGEPPKDPSGNAEFAYSLSANGMEFQVASAYLAGTAHAPAPGIPSALAADSVPVPKAAVSGNYNGLFVPVNAGGTNFLVPAPSIILSDLSVPELKSAPASGPSFVADGLPGTPASWSGKVAGLSQTGIAFPAAKTAAYSSATEAFPATSTGVAALAETLAQAYSGTSLAALPKVSAVVKASAAGDSSGLASAVAGAGVSSLGRNLAPAVAALAGDVPAAGSSGGSSGTPATPVDGACGTPNGQTLVSAPSENLCSPGTPSAVADGASWTWSCAGTDGGATASCSAAKLPTDPDWSGTVLAMHFDRPATKAYAKLDTVNTVLGVSQIGNITNNGLTYVGSASAYNAAKADLTNKLTGGKYYFEATLAAKDSAGNNAQVGITSGAAGAGNGVFWDVVYTNGNRNVSSDGGSSYTNTAAASAVNDVYMVAYDATTGKVWLGVNGAWYNSGDPAGGTGQAGAITTTNALIVPFVRVYGTVNKWNMNFGQDTSKTYQSSADGHFAYAPPSGFTAINSSTVSTNFRAFADQKGKTATAYGDVKIVAGAGKFGDAAYFDGNGDYLSVLNGTDFQFGASDWTIEAWVNPDDLSGVKNIVSRWHDGTFNDRPWQFYLYGSAVGLDLAVGNNSPVFSLNTGGSITAGWRHVAATRSGTNVLLFVDGNLVKTTDLGNSVSFDPGTSNVGIGGSNINWSPNYFFKGYIDDLRITKGIARYTANFDVPTAPFADQ